VVNGLAYEKCNECGKVFYDWSEYRAKLRLKQHLKDKHGLAAEQKKEAT
jgi:hypothetical protein